MVRRVALAGALAVVALAGAAFAAEKAGKPAPPPARIDAAGIDTWLKTYIDQEGWVLLGADGAAVTLGARDVDPTETGMLRVDIRREFYKPVRMGAMNSRSNRQTWVVDCAKRKIQIVSMNVFLNNNMKGDSFQRRAFDNDWTDVVAGTPDGQVFDRICAAAPKAN